jgi:hypothetical protein
MTTRQCSDTDLQPNQSASEQTKALDKRKEEYLAAMGVGKDKTKFWANDDVVVLPLSEQEPHQQQQQQQQQALTINSKSDKLLILNNKHSTGTVDASELDRDHEDDNNSDDDDDDDDDESSVASDDSGGQGAEILRSSQTKTLPLGSVVTDLDFLRSKATVKDELESDDEDESNVPNK